MSLFLLCFVSAPASWTLLLPVRISVLHIFLSPQLAYFSGKKCPLHSLSGGGIVYPELVQTSWQSELDCHLGDYTGTGQRSEKNVLVV